MKLKILIISSLFMCFFFTSCEDFLEEENKANADAESYYLTEAGFESLVNANYSAFRDIYGQDPWLFMCGTDLYVEGRNSEPVGLSRYTELSPSSEGVEFLYDNCYVAIQRANTALYYADITEQTSSIEERKGEIKYLRADAYFLLVQTYGGVSLITAKLDEAVTEYSRNSAEEVYTFIISELEDALELVPDEDFDGRVKKRAVYHLLAKVHLTRGYEESFAASDDFAKAAAYADSAISNQSLTIPFADLWVPGNEMNSETLFSVQFDASSISTNPTELGNQQQNFFGSYTGGSDISGKAPYKSYNLCPTRFALDLFTEDDERWEATFMTQVYDPYFAFFDGVDESDSVVHFYEPQWFTTQDSIDYVEANPKAEYHSYGTHDPDGGNVSNDYGTIIVKKFDDPDALFSAGGASSTRDVIVSRLGETYLIAAEAYLEAGESATGLSRLNEVRNRAGLADATLADFDIDLILDERGRELLGEYKRWFDLKRTGKLVERASAHNRLISESNFEGNNDQQKILRPIPQDALDLNQSDDFDQNPAYK